MRLTISRSPTKTRKLQKKLKRAFHRFKDDADALSGEIDSALGELVKVRMETQSLVKTCMENLIASCINPSGVQIDHLDEELWPLLFRRHDRESLSEAEQGSLKFVSSMLKHEVRRVITDSMSRDFESLGFGWLTFDYRKIPDRYVGNKRYIGFIDSIVRFLSFYWRTRSDLDNTAGCDSLPKYFTDWIADVFPGLFRRWWG